MGKINVWQVSMSYEWGSEIDGGCIDEGKHDVRSLSADKASNSLRLKLWSSFRVIESRRQWVASWRFHITAWMWV